MELEQPNIIIEIQDDSFDQARDFKELLERSFYEDTPIKMRVRAKVKWLYVGSCEHGMQVGKRKLYHRYECKLIGSEEDGQ